MLVMGGHDWFFGNLNGMGELGGDSEPWRISHDAEVVLGEDAHGHGLPRGEGQSTEVQEYHPWSCSRGDMTSGLVEQDGY